MDSLIALNEGTIRLGAFLGIFLAMAMLELAAPRRSHIASKRKRWLTNLLIGGTGVLVVRLMALLAVPVVAVAAALWAQDSGWGVLNWTDWPGWVEMLLALLVLDLAIYGQHVASHKVPLFWRLHKVHHCDVDFDVTTAVRFHPVEIALSMLWKIVVVVAIGASAWAVVLFEIALNGCAMFNHANISMPAWLDRAIRLFIVTPDMHRVHHSVYRDEHDTNFGFNLSVWDRLFRTYTPQPRDGHTGMTIGITKYLGEKPTGFLWSLRLPFMPTGGKRD